METKFKSGAETSEIYRWADNAINAAPCYQTGFTQLIASQPFQAPAGLHSDYSDRLPHIRAFQQAALEIFRAALRGDLRPAILHWLINESPVGLDLAYHRRLEDRHFTLPVFLRTDEVRPGRIAEIQCPGSAWGDLQLAYEYAGAMGWKRPQQSPAMQFAAQLTDYLSAPPAVQHFLDSASAPAGVRFFIERTRPIVKYWSIDPHVRARDCNFVRGHSVIGLYADNEFEMRMANVGQGLAYDLPPYILFDQKAPLVLPFWSETRQYFSDEVRGALLFSTPLLPSGIELEDGLHLTIEQFAAIPHNRRTYFLKYAGANIALNWGSKAVYRLSNMGHEACLDFLRQCLSGYERGQVWLLQKEDGQDDEITYATRDGQTHTEVMRAKFSGFYGPADCLGVMVWHRQHFKVHGQEETVMSYVLE